MSSIFSRFKKRDRGQGLVEYGLILSLISIVAVGALGGVGDKVSGTFNKVTLPSFDGGVYSASDIDKMVLDGYIPIATADDLDKIRDTGDQVFGVGTKWEGVYKSGLSSNYIQVSDIDMGDVLSFEPIGDVSDSFSGSFDGGGYTISHLVINLPGSDYVGLFGRSLGASFVNVGLEDVVIVGLGRVGGLIGENRDSTIKNSYSNGKVTGYGMRVGGLVGLNNSTSEIYNSYSSGKVSGPMQFDHGTRVGGLVGEQFNNPYIVNSYANSVVTGDSQVGGLVGFQSRNSVIKDKYTTVKNSYSEGQVFGRVDVGGLVGYHSVGSLIDNGYSFSTVTSTGVRVGGLVGHSRGIIGGESTSGWIKSHNPILNGIGSETHEGSSYNVVDYTESQLRVIVEKLF